MRSTYRFDETGSESLNTIGASFIHGLAARNIAPDFRLIKSPKAHIAAHAKADDTVFMAQRDRGADLVSASCERSETSLPSMNDGISAQQHRAIKSQRKFAESGAHGLRGAISVVRQVGFCPASHTDNVKAGAFEKLVSSR